MYWFQARFLLKCPHKLIGPGTVKHKVYLLAAQRSTCCHTEVSSSSLDIYLLVNEDEKNAHQRQKNWVTTLLSVDQVEDINAENMCKNRAMIKSSDPSVWHLKFLNPYIRQTKWKCLSPTMFAWFGIWVNLQEVPPIGVTFEQISLCFTPFLATLLFFDP